MTVEDQSIKNKLLSRKKGLDCLLINYVLSSQMKGKHALYFDEKQKLVWAKMLLPEGAIS